MKIALVILAIVGYVNPAAFPAYCTYCRNKFVKQCKDENPGKVQDEVRTRATLNGQNLEVYCSNGEGDVVTVLAKKYNTGRYYIIMSKMCTAMMEMDCGSGGKTDGDVEDVPVEEPGDAGEKVGENQGKVGENQGDKGQGSDAGDTGLEVLEHGGADKKPKGQSGDQIDTTKYQERYKRCNEVGSSRAVKQFAKVFKKDVPDCVKVEADGKNVVISCCCGASETIPCEEVEKNGRTKISFNLADFFQKLNGICSECGECDCFSSLRR